MKTLLNNLLIIVKFLMSLLSDLTSFLLSNTLFKLGLGIFITSFLIKIISNKLIHHRNSKEIKYSIEKENLTINEIWVKLDELGKEPCNYDPYTGEILDK